MSFCTVVNCMDGRVQDGVAAYLRKRFDARWVDTITEPGPNRLLGESGHEAEVAAILARVDVSVNHHGSVGLAVVGHEDCAGNPVGEAEQASQTQAAVERIRRHYPGLTVIGLWYTLDGTVSEV